MNNSFYIDNTKCDILHCFKHDNTNYIIYKDNEDILASRFIITSNRMILLPISDNEWNIVNKEWKKING